MSSELLNIYAAFAGATVTVGSTAIGAYALNQLPGAIPASDLPKRILLPFGRRPSIETVELPVQGYEKARWRIVDLMLWKPVGEGEGPSVVAVPLVQYKVAYIDMVAGLALPGGVNQNEAISIQFLADVIPWPGANSTEYWAVEAVTTVEEFLL